MGRVMKLVVKYVISDDCTYAFDVHQPIEYESEEAFICDFEDALQTAIQNRKPEFKTGSTTFETWDFAKTYEKLIVTLPEVYTLENWFRRYKQ